jgi:hypothetical protein
VQSVAPASAAVLAGAALSLLLLAVGLARHS